MADEKKQIELKHMVGGIICGILTAFGIVALNISLVNGSNDMWTAVDCTNIVLLILIVWYAFGGYKIPHGNLLKYIILIIAALSIFCIIPYARVENVAGIVLVAAQIGLACYIAGRLNREKENRILMIIVAAIRVAMFVIDSVSGNITIGAVAPLVIWADICVAYFLYNKEHLEAGREEDSKK